MVHNNNSKTNCLVAIFLLLIAHVIYIPAYVQSVQLLNSSVMLLSCMIVCKCMHSVELIRPLGVTSDFCGIFIYLFIYSFIYLDAFNLYLYET